MVSDTQPSKKENKCIFCKISRGDISSERIYENKSFFSIYDQNQEVNGHALIISKEHYPNILDVPNEFGEDMMECIKETFKIIKSKYLATGFNVLGNNGKVSGQLIDHFHIHILPRKDSDNIQIPF